MKRAPWRLRLSGAQRWTRPILPEPTNAARWATFCRNIDARIEAVRAEDGIDSALGDGWRTFAPRLRVVSRARPLPIGTTRLVSARARDASGRFERAS